MRVKASDLYPGQVVTLEYGAPDNWIRFTVDQVIHFEKMVTVKCHSQEMETDFSCQKEELVEVCDEQR